ncbi:MAG TPA: hypothetical protein VKZ53_10600 [Candidatus Angelobacter sp.]|nr:hypothetical protein [Candidatus Angelobacter sp.]
MSSTIVTAQTPSRISSLRVSQAQTVPWYVWSCVIASASIMIGLYWDISWHATIGRDTFWTPAHLLIQFAALLTAFSSSGLIFSTTFAGSPAAKGASVNVLGFRGPLGAFISAWGGVAMLTSAPFDNWWHDAYGLDVKIISPPHALLALGIGAILAGGVILILGEMNRAQGALRKQLEYLLLLSGGLLLILYLIFNLQNTGRVMMHSSVCYVAVVIGLPLLLEAMSRALNWKFGRTAMASVYTLFFLLSLWIFPLFPGEPKLGPVYRQVTHMIPMGFPLLILIPALVLDLLQANAKTQAWGKWKQSLVAGIVFLGVLIGVQWPFANFLMSPGARNWIFGTHYIYYAAPPTSLDVRYLFYQSTVNGFWMGMAAAIVVSILSARLGIVWGDWMGEVRR